MAATIRLMRFGKKKKAMYRIIVVDKKKKRDTKYIDSLGVYNPAEEKNKIVLNKKKFDYWTEKGAFLSEGLSRLLKNKSTVNFT